MKSVTTTTFLVGLALLSCFNDNKNPVKYSGKLARRGHIDLYQNGAFRIPATEVRIIPKGSTTINIVKDYIGIRARDGFLLALKEAADSVVIVKDGNRKVFQVAKTITREGNQIADQIRKDNREQGIMVIQKSWAASLGIWGDTWAISKELLLEMKLFGDAVILAGKEAHDAIDRELTRKGLKILKTSLRRSALISKGSFKRTRENVSEAVDNMVLGYSALPIKAAADFSAAGKAFKDANPAKIAREENEWRQKYSSKFTGLIVNAGKNYTSNIKTSFKNAVLDLKDYKNSGISFATLKAIRWVLKGILYDAVIKPVVQITIGAAGFLTVNGIAFPVMVVGKETAQVAYAAVKLTAAALVNTYRVVAPTAILAVAGVFGFFDIVLSNTAAAGSLVGSATAGALLTGTGKTTAVVVRSAGYAGGKAVQYIGVPLASAGIAVAGGVAGAVVAVSGAAAGTTVLAAGETGAAVTQAGAYAVSGVVLSAGSAVVTASGFGRGAYYIVKAGLVPSAYTMGTGLVMGYSAASQLAAHTILGVADFAYLVLSLEGPRWVVYAVRGKLGKGRNIPAGSVLDLNKMRNAGEEIYSVPVSEHEMRKVVNTIKKDFPVDARSEPKKAEKKNKK